MTWSTEHQHPWRSAMADDKRSPAETGYPSKAFKKKTTQSVDKLDRRGDKGRFSHAKSSTKRRRGRKGHLQKKLLWFGMEKVFYLGLRRTSTPKFVKSN